LPVVESGTSLVWGFIRFTGDSYDKSPVGPISYEKRIEAWGFRQPPLKEGSFFFS